MHALAMVVPPQEPDRAPQENPPALLSLPKGLYAVIFIEAF